MRRRACLGSLAALAAGALAPARAAPDRPRFAVALGSGSMHGVAHIGVQRGLEKLGLVPDLIAGTSSGAAVGALWAGGLDSSALAEVARDIDFGSVSSLASPFPLPWQGLMNNQPLADAIERALGGRRIEQLPVPFKAVATELASGAPIVLDAGPVGRAVAASSAIPVLYAPVKIDGRELVDGSLAAPLPVDAAREQGARFVLAVDVAYRPSDEKPRGLVDIAFQSYHILVNHLAAEQARRADLVLWLALHALFDKPQAQAFDALVQAGEAALLAHADLLHERLGGSPVRTRRQP